MNIILISLDTLSAKHVGCYGYRRNTTPNLYKYSETAVIFENCFAPGIPTQPSYTTTFLGRVPLDHVIVVHGGTADIKLGVIMMQELLSDVGYHTACISALFGMKPWFKRGWNEELQPTEIPDNYAQMVTVEAINRTAIPWLQSRKPGEKFFLFLHYLML